MLGLDLYHYSIISYQFRGELFLQVLELDLRHYPIVCYQFGE